MNRDDILERLTPLLRCPLCEHERLEIRLGSGPSGPFELLDRHIACPSCDERFPVTEDLIPVMWSEELRNHMHQAQTRQNLAANVDVYNSIAEDYLHHSRQDGRIGQRIRTGIRQVSPNTEGKLHLDFGCGPGHVLRWVESFGMTSIGMDVSLVGLRVARRSVNATVVCGDATKMPFRSSVFDYVSESSVLHHIEDWGMAVSEACRVCREGGGVVFDSEPSSDQMAWSRLAVAVFDARFPVYKLLSHFLPGKYVFRDSEQARKNVAAEIHHQPGTGISVDRLRSILEKSGLRPEVIVSPTPELRTRARPDWKNILLSALSARNPWNPQYGAFTAVGHNS